ncbi:MAG TPA: sulfotransferase [Isosphaeraceae bacterium]|jgi:hypothetical protein|nr:sulfotransferase [Isosphaeraceae bacterium]
MSVETATIEQSAAGPRLELRAKLPAGLRAFNGVGRALKRLGVEVTRLDAEAEFRRAERVTGLSDWGQDQSFWTPARMLFEAAESEAGLHPFGRALFRVQMRRLLENRLKIEEDFKNHPEIRDVPIRRPLIVVGLPRSGTTLLHRLLALEPSGRPLVFWEAMWPSPPPEEATYTTDPRVGRTRLLLKGLLGMMPALRAIHDAEADAPEECNPLLEHNFTAHTVGGALGSVTYVDWLLAHDMVGPYRFLRRLLQLLMWRKPADHWVLKNPAHTWYLDALLAVFPDACLVQTHRDPKEVIPSLCSLWSQLRTLFTDRIDLRLTGRRATEIFAEATRRALAVRATADPARFLDVTYESLLRDPVSVVTRIHDHFGLPRSPDLADRVRDWLAANPQHKHGSHRYTLEQFGLDAPTLDRAFADYRAAMPRGD